MCLRHVLGLLHHFSCHHCAPAAQLEQQGPWRGARAVEHRERPPSRRCAAYSRERVGRQLQVAVRCGLEAVGRHWLPASIEASNTGANAARLQITLVWQAECARAWDCAGTRQYTCYRIKNLVEI